MSIVVENLTKIYGQQRALDQISFEAPKGVVTGFLGPNGAGKSTTMKIATGYINATSGRMVMNGEVAATTNLKIKRMTGYLPESNPLYLEMYVREYLSFIASAYSLQNVNKKVGDMIDLCGLGLEKRKKIGQLSKGYRQRVGLAQALIHDPEILILDEPTSGLDPNQLVEIRRVIKETSQNKTVVLSSHIMQEVEALCDKVVIINQGKIVADDQLHNLKRQNEHVTYLVEFEMEIDISTFEQSGLNISKDGLHYRISGIDDPRKMIMQIVSAQELPLLNIQKEEASLESVFQSLTSQI